MKPMIRVMKSILNDASRHLMKHRRLVCGEQNGGASLGPVRDARGLEITPSIGRRVRRWSALLSGLCAWALATCAVADPIPGTPGVTETIDGTGGVTSGVVLTYDIPVVNWPATLFLEARGADGGYASAGPDSNPER